MSDTECAQWLVVFIFLIWVVGYTLAMVRIKGTTDDTYILFSPKSLESELCGDKKVL